MKNMSVYLCEKQKKIDKSLSERDIKKSQFGSSFSRGKKLGLKMGIIIFLSSLLQTPFRFNKHIFKRFYLSPEPVLL